MNEELQEYIDSLSEIRDDLNNLIPEARGIMKDLKRMIKETKTLIESESVELVKDNMDKAIGAFMEEYFEHIKEEVEKADKRISKKFDSIYDAFMGRETKDDVPLDVLLYAYGAIESLVKKAAEKENVVIVGGDRQLPRALRVQKSKPKINDPRGKTPPWRV